MTKILPKSCLYVTYDGLLDPLGYSQILSYEKNLAKNGWKITIVSFEKAFRKREDVSKLKKELIEIGIDWHPMKFKKGKYQYLMRLIFGISKISCLNIRKNYSLIHVRGILSAAIVSLAFISAPIIYDIRAFVGEMIDCGMLKRGGFISNYLVWLDKRLIQKAKAIVVLDRSGHEYLIDKYNINPKRLTIIPTCTDLSKYNHPAIENKVINDRLKFVFLGGVRYPYRPDMALVLIDQLLKHSINCQIDFINELDHAFIAHLAKEINIPNERLNIFSCLPAEVPEALVRYDCGLVFNSVGIWRKMSSPTKIGEYLAAGLHVLGLSGICALDRLAIQGNISIDNISEEQLEKGIDNLTLERIISNIKNPSRPINSIKTAEEIYDINKARKQYLNIYSQAIGHNGFSIL